MTQPCTVCAAYARVRGPRIMAEIRTTTPARDRAATWKRFMAGVHQRHLDQARGNVRALGRITALMAAVVSSTCDKCGGTATHTGMAYPPGGSFPITGCMPCLEDLAKDIDVRVRPISTTTDHPEETR